IEQQGMVASNYQTDLVVYRDHSTVPGAEAELEPILDDSVRMNKPLKFEGYTIYQSEYQLNEFSTMTFKIHETADSEEETIDTFTVNLRDPEFEYELDNGFRIELEQYFPDYYLDD